jgi:hypothetical protein
MVVLLDGSGHSPNFYPTGTSGVQQPTHRLRCGTRGNNIVHYGNAFTRKRALTLARECKSSGKIRNTLLARQPGLHGRAAHTPAKVQYHSLAQHRWQAQCNFLGLIIAAGKQPPTM